MNINKIGILDCTLRDGGYVNNWKWGFLRAQNIVLNLTRTGVDFIEVGFLRNVNGYDQDVTVCNHIEELNRLLPDECGCSIYSAMAMCSNYDISKLSPYSGQGIELIRITAHDYDIDEGLKFAAKVKSLGYKTSINPINIMGYTTQQVFGIIRKVNEIDPYQFSIVDTFGSMKLRDLERLVRFLDIELNPNARLGLHLHENMALSVALSQRFLDIGLRRNITIDASLMGIGRDPGNLPIELIADHINDIFDAEYKIEFLLDSIENHISSMHGKAEWGYNPAYFLSARHNLHRNYSDYYLGKGDLTHRDINALFDKFDKEKKTTFDEDYADLLYVEYKSNNIDDTNDREQLRSVFAERDMLIFAPGATLTTHRKAITDFIAVRKPVIISVNFIPEDYTTDYVFFGNARRYQMFGKRDCKIITSSNFSAANSDYHLNYVKLFNKNDKYISSMLLFLRFLVQIDIKCVSFAGADGFSNTNQNYFDEYMWSTLGRNEDINKYTSGLLYGLGLKLNFVTPSMYEKNLENLMEFYWNKEWNSGGSRCQSRRVHLRQVHRRSCSESTVNKLRARHPPEAVVNRKREGIMGKKPVLKQSGTCQ
ncbi:MAG: aldolase catalytic domain-containing protein, partial [Tannerellaceae bacterium]|nr:aldolase catalytic domain-containing protein [Tannerellaceae bacterium]